MKWTALHYRPIRIKTISLLFTNILFDFNSLPCVKAKGVICRQHDGVDRCCTNYREERGICIPCIGSFGINCTGGKCVEGFFGFGCRRKCDCSVHEECDHRIGCQKKVSELSSSTTVTETHSLVVIIPMCAVIFCLLILLLAAVIRSNILLNRLRIQRFHGRNNTNSTDTGSQNYVSADYQSYVECDPISVTGVNYPENHFEHSDNNEITSGLYVSPVLPRRVDVQMPVKDTLKKNRERTGILHGNLLQHDPSYQSGYLSAVHRQQNQNNEEAPYYADVEDS